MGAVEMAEKKKNYLREAADDALEAIEHFSDEIAEQILKKGKASKSLHHYPGGASYKWTARKPPASAVGMKRRP